MGGQELQDRQITLERVLFPYLSLQLRQEHMQGLGRNWQGLHLPQ